jgi:hypothetical protein
MARLCISRGLFRQIEALVEVPKFDLREAQAAAASLGCQICFVDYRDGYDSEGFHKTEKVQAELTEEEYDNPYYNPKTELVVIGINSRCAVVQVRLRHEDLVLSNGKPLSYLTRALRGCWKKQFIELQPSAFRLESLPNVMCHDHWTDRDCDDSPNSDFGMAEFGGWITAEEASGFRSWLQRNPWLTQS